ncbi:MAG: hypothetical protein ORN51_13640, partial [Akkermansiaceae bacterium]|nr:hypothetical protein [Akkermansiaceae bacterium]
MKSQKSLIFRIAPLAATVVTLASPSALAAPRTWNGGGANNNWSPAANWGGTAPVAGDTLTFAGTTRSSST